MGPQILYPGKFDVVQGVRTPSRYEVAAESKMFGMSSEARTPVTKPFYVPPYPIGIRELIAQNNGVDPTQPTSNYVSVALTNRLTQARARAEPFPRDKYAAPYMRLYPTDQELSGLGGVNALVRPYGIGIDPLGSEFNAMRDGPLDPNVKPQSPYQIKDLQPPVPPKVVELSSRPLFTKPDGSPTAPAPTAAPAADAAPAPAEGALLESEADVDAEFEKLGLTAEESESESESESDASFLEMEATIASPQYDIKHAGPINLAFTEGSSAVKMVKQLPESIRQALEERERNNPMFPPSPLEEKKLVVAQENRPVIVKKLGSKEALAMLETNQQQQQEQQQQQQQQTNTEAKTEATAEAKVDATAEAKALAEAELRAKIEQEIREKLAAEREAEERSRLEAEARAATEAEEAAMKAVEAETEDRAQAQADSLIEGQSLAEVEAKQELDALVEAVAHDTIKSQETLVSKAMNRLKKKINDAATKAAKEATEPWWNRESGIKQNEANKQTHSQTTATPLAQFTEMKSTARGQVWDPPAATLDTPLAKHGMDLNMVSGPAAKKGYGAVPTPVSLNPAALMETGAAAHTQATASATAGSGIAPMYHAYPPHSGQAVVKVQRQANPYAFSTMDLLYPKLRRVWGLSGWPATGAEDVVPTERAQTPFADRRNYNGNPAASSTLNSGGRRLRSVGAGAIPSSSNPNSIIINVNGAAPAPALTQTTTAATATSGAGAYPVGAGAASPYSTYFPGSYSPPPSHVIHAGAPTPGSQLPDHGSFGELKV